MSKLLLESNSDHVLSGDSKINECEPARNRSMSVEKILKSSDKQRQFAIAELLSTERTYLKGLRELFELFYNPMKNILTEVHHQTIFTVLPEILMINASFLTKLENGLAKHPSLLKLGNIFKHYLPNTKCYSTYAINFNQALELLTSLKKSNKHLALLMQNEAKNPRLNGQTIESLMLTPIQRIPRHAKKLIK